jgi:hypothetical protein
MTQTYTVRFYHENEECPEYIAPFHTLKDAENYCESRNSSLQLAGIPSSVACYYVID